MATKISRLIGFFNLIFGELNEEEKAILEEKLIECYNQKEITFDDNSLNDLSVHRRIKDEYSEWAIQCIYRKVAQQNQFSNVILISLIKAKYFYYYQHMQQKWSFNKIKDVEGFSENRNR